MWLYLKPRGDSDPAHMLVLEYPAPDEEIWEKVFPPGSMVDYVVVGLLEVVSEVIFHSRKNLDYDTPQEAVRLFVGLATTAGFRVEAAFEKKGQLAKGACAALVHETQGREEELERIARQAGAGLMLAEIKWNHGWERPVVGPFEQLLQTVGQDQHGRDEEVLAFIRERMPQLLKDSRRHLDLLVFFPALPV